MAKRKLPKPRPVAAMLQKRSDEIGQEIEAEKKADQQTSLPRYTGIPGKKLIVIADNFGRDYRSERWLATPVLPEQDAKIVCDILNKAEGPGGQDYYKAVDTDYKLYRFVP